MTDSPQHKSATMTDKLPHNAVQGSNNITVSEVKLSSSTAKHFAPTNIGIEDEYVYCSVAIPKNQFPIALQSDTEKKLIEQKAAVQILKDCRLTSYASVNKHSFLIKVEKNDPNSGLPVAAQLNSKKYSAVVVVYRGEGKIDNDELDQAINESLWINNRFDRSDEKVKTSRVWNSKSEKDDSGLRWHWTGVKFYNRNSQFDPPLARDDLEKLACDLAKTLGKAEGDIHAYHIPIEAATSSTFTLPDLTTGNSPMTLPIEHELRKDVLRALLEQEYIGANESFDTENDPATLIEGLQLVNGKERRLASISGTTPLLYESASSKLFFKQEQTVSSFMLECFGNGRKLDLPHDNKKFNQALKGKRVNFLVKGEWQTKPIAKVETTLVKDVLDEKKFSAWLPQGHDEPDLPCLNVGTEASPRFMPPEKCILLPGQTFAKPITNAIRTQLNGQRTSTGSTTVEQTAYAISSVNVGTDEKDSRKSALEKVFKGPFGKKVKVCFIQFTDDSPPEGVLEEFRKCVVNIPTAKGLGTANWTSLTLKLSSSESNWNAELKKMAKDHATFGQNLIAVVLLGESSDKFDKFAAYENLKRIFDVEVGMEAYFLTAKHLEKKGVQGATGEIVRRMSTRHLPKGSAKKGASKLEVAIHIEEIALQNESPSGYLVVIAAKDALSSSGYRTFRELVHTEEMDQYDLAARLSEFLDNKFKFGSDGTIPTQVTIIRSGYVVEQRPGELKKESDKIQDAAKAHMAHDGQFSYLILDHAAADTLVSQKDASKVSNPRTLVLTDAEIRSDGSTRFFRIHRPRHAQSDRTKLQTTAIGMILTGHRLDGTEFAIESKPPSRHDSAESLVASGREQKPMPIVISPKFTPGLKPQTRHMRSSAIRNKENEIPSLVPAMATFPSSKPLAERRTPSNPETMRKISTGPDPFGSPPSPAGNSPAKTPSPLSERRIPSNPETLRKVSTESSPDALSLSLTDNDTPARKRHLRKADFEIHIPPVIFQDPVVGQDSKKQEALTTSEMERIGHLWKDHLLDLNDQKFPVVTHLAHAVAKRAKLHIMSVNGKPVLLPVNAEVVGTLYFL
ncbi:hypothetical protein CBER1_09449 [Cercospora berteroae]|uniref:PAZ domain-containing protein n=1 Tax=Cercospora berteroae TaxID=357750 RepID=A0A2S6CNX7_9PEZI|nr:hypothetical protein CBER1_09449 [Cercospora berteroae]